MGEINICMKIFSILLSIVFIGASALISAAQTPEQIDVKFMEISKIGAAGLTSFKMKALNSAQNPVIYQSADSAALGVIPFTTACNPCSPPKLFDTNIFPSEMLADLGTNAGQVRFYISSSASSLLALNQRVLSKKTDFFMNGVTMLEGRIEIRNASGFVTAVDNNVILEGYYSVLFGKPYVSQIGRRLTDFKSLIYSINAPAN